MSHEKESKVSLPFPISIFSKVYFVLALLCLNTSPAHAYIGPGLSVGGIIIILLVLLSLALAFYAIVWFPIKRRLKNKNQHFVEKFDNQNAAKSESEKTE